MDRHKDKVVPELERDAARCRDFNRLAEKGAGGNCAQRNDDPGFDQFNFTLKPPATGLDMAGRRALVKTSLTALGVSKMFNRIGDVASLSFDPDFTEAPIEELASRADQGAASDIFLVAGLFGNEENSGINGSFAENGLCCISIELATLTSLRFCADLLKDVLATRDC